VGDPPDAEFEAVLMTAKLLGTAPLEVDLCPSTYHLAVTFPAEVYSRAGIMLPVLGDPTNSSDAVEFDGMPLLLLLLQPILPIHRMQNCMKYKFKLAKSFG